MNEFCSCAHVILTGIKVHLKLTRSCVELSHPLFCPPNPAVAVIRESRSSNAQVGAGGSVVGPGAPYLYPTLLAILQCKALKTTRIFSALLDELILDATLQSHHEVARSRAVCPVCNTQ